MRSNTHGELSALERGMHALRRPRESVRNEVYAAEVASVAHVGHDLSGYFRHLTEAHAARRWVWPALVEWIASASGLRRACAAVDLGSCVAPLRFL